MRRVVVWTVIWTGIAWAMGSCAADSSDDDEQEALQVARTDEERQHIRALYDLIDRAHGLRDRPGVSAEHRAALGAAADAAREAIADYIDKHGQGDTRAVVMARLKLAAGGVLANDSTGVGLADDWLLIVCAVGAIATYILTRHAASESELDASWKNVGARLGALESAIEATMAALAADKTCPERNAEHSPALPIQPGNRPTVDLAPMPAPRQTEPDQPDETCETRFPNTRECWTLPDSYLYPSPQSALRAMKTRTGDHSLKVHSRRRAKTGPCPREGWHYNVREGARRAGSIVCCPCCSDNPGGPAMETQCRIVW